MRLLVINPNISVSVTALIEAEARRSAPPGTGFTFLTAPFGVAYIETRFEALIGASAVAQLAADHWPGHGGVMRIDDRKSAGRLRPSESGARTRAWRPACGKLYPS